MCLFFLNGFLSLSLSPFYPVLPAFLFSLLVWTVCILSSCSVKSINSALSAGHWVGWSLSPSFFSFWLFFSVTCVPLGRGPRVSADPSPLGERVKATACQPWRSLVERGMPGGGGLGRGAVRAFRPLLGALPQLHPFS